MKKMDIFENRPMKSSFIPHKPKYDVRITLNKNGKNRFTIRFGLLNNAKKLFSEYSYIQISQVEKSQEKIYFKPKKEKIYGDDYKLSKSKSKSGGLYFAFSPTREAEKIYRSKWLNQTVNILFDKEAELYYIELPQNTEYE